MLMKPEGYRKACDFAFAVITETEWQKSIDDIPRKRRKHGLAPHYFIGQIVVVEIIENRAYEVGPRARLSQLGCVYKTHQRLIDAVNHANLIYGWTDIYK